MIGVMKQILLGILIFILFFVGTAYYVGERGPSGGIGPDSIFYFLDSFEEWVELHIFIIPIRDFIIKITHQII